MVNTVIHALFAPRPKAKYPVGTLGVLPAWAGAKLASFLPDRALDAIILAFAPKDAVLDDYYKSKASAKGK